MAKFIRNVSLRPSRTRPNTKDLEAQAQQEKSIFSYQKCCEYGFPSKPSSLSYDPVLDLLAVATRTGAIRIYGKPGVYLSAQHPESECVTKICFIPGQGRVLCLCSNNSLHLWEIVNDVGDKSCLKYVKSCSLATRSTVLSWCLLVGGHQMLLGDENSSLHVFDVHKFSVTQSFHHERIALSYNNDTRLNPGALVSIIQCPIHENKVLIGYARGLVVLWNLTENSVVRTFHSDQQLESLSFVGSTGRAFVSAHSDGSYMVWSVEDSSSPQEDATSPYGPFPCMAISKMEWYSSDSGDPLLIFTGGMPRANYGDRHTLSLMSGEDHVVLDMTSKIIDFIVISTPADSNEAGLESGLPHSLLILAEEELVSLDLQTDGWPVHRLPYFSSIHSSPVTCVSYSHLVPDSLYNKIKQAGAHLFEHCSVRDWPIQGGTVKNSRPTVGSNLLLTGHEDGSVRFWDVTFGCISLVYQLNTAKLFGVDTNLVRTDSSFDVEWPPFRKVGWYDPFTDDPRLAVNNLVFCPQSETLLMVGQSGQIILHHFEREEQEQDVKVSTLNMRGGGDVVVGGGGSSEVVWRSYAPLEVKTEDVRFAAGFQPVQLVQILPPVKCTAVSYQSQWQLLGVSSEYGFGLFDFAQKKIILSFSSSTDSADAIDGVVTRSQSWRKSLRQSMRNNRLYRSVSAVMSRRRRPQQTNSTETRTTQEPSNNPTSSGVVQSVTPNTGSQTASTSTAPTGSLRPSDSRSNPGHTLSSKLRGSGPFSSLSASKLKPSSIKSIHFTDSFILSGQSHGPMMLLGTATGQVFAYRIQIGETSRRELDAVVCTLAKAVCMRHGACVINLFVTDRLGRVVADGQGSVNQTVQSVDMSGGHQLIVCTQQQIKIFQLPNLKALKKLKIAAQPGDSPILLSAVSTFTSADDNSYTETDVVCLDKNLNFGIFSLPQLRSRLTDSVILKDYASGLGIVTLNRQAVGFCLSSFSELQQFTLSTHHSMTQSVCSVTPASCTQRSATRTNDVHTADGISNGDVNQVLSAGPSQTSTSERSAADQTSVLVDGNGRNESGMITEAQDSSEFQAVIVAAADSSSSTSAADVQSNTAAPADVTSVAVANGSSPAAVMQTTGAQTADADDYSSFSLRALNGHRKSSEFKALSMKTTSLTDNKTTMVTTADVHSMSVTAGQAFGDTLERAKRVNADTNLTSSNRILLAKRSPRLRSSDKTALVESIVK